MFADIITQLNELRKLSGNAQLEFLNNNKSPLLKEILDYTYNPNKMYNINETKLALVTIKKGLIKRKLKPCFTQRDWEEFKQLLDNLVDKGSSDLDDVRVLKYFITGFSGLDIPQLLSQIVNKDLRLNLGIKKIQTVWPDFCNAPQVQLADSYEGKNFEYGFYSRKFDGKRMYMLDGVAYSRTNKVCKPAPIKHIIEQFRQAGMDLNKYVLDGELLYFNEDGSEDFKKVTSLSSRDDRLKECDNLYYVIFDLIPREDFINKNCYLPFIDSYNLLYNILRGKESQKFGMSILETKLPNVLIACQHKTNTEIGDEANQKGWEGLMYRDAYAPYQCRRTKNLLKIKSMQDKEFTILGYTSGTGRNINRLGALYIDFKGNKVGVGSGFTDEDREIIWDNLYIFTDKNVADKFYAKVQYFEETRDADGNPSLRFPVFKCFRDKETKEEYTTEEVLRYYKGVENV